MMKYERFIVGIVVMLIIIGCMFNPSYGEVPVKMYQTIVILSYQVSVILSVGLVIICFLANTIVVVKMENKK